MRKLQGMAKVVGRKAGEKVANLALSTGERSVNSACVSWFHQPRAPKEMDRFKKR